MSVICLKPRWSLICLGIVSLLLSCDHSWASEARGMVYKFGAVWCGPCQRVAPVVDRLQREGNSIRSIDIDQQPEIAQRFRVERVPTFILVVDGREVDRVVGMMTEGELRAMLNRIPAANPPEVVVQPAANTTQVEGQPGLKLELGDAAPFPRPTTQPVDQVKLTETPPDSQKGLPALWPFGKKNSEPPVYRGTDGVLANTPVGEALPATNDPMSASVRIRVKQGDSMNLGSGTIVLSRVGHTVIVTCGHVFRNLTDAGRIEVDVFQQGQSKLYLARLERFDERADVGVISIPTDEVLPVVPVGKPAAAPTDGDAVACIGCSAGDQPTREQLRVTAIDRYEGPHNIECTGLPVRGRSGGGLFNQRGELVGVCIAADQKGQRGLYAGLFAVHSILDECSLSSLYQPVPAPVSPATPPMLVENTTGSGAAAPVAVPGSGGAVQPQATQPVDVEAGTAEVVVIIREKDQPGAPQRIVIIREASPSFLRYLKGELEPGAAPRLEFGQQRPAAAGDAAPVMTETRRPALPAGTPEAALPALSRPVRVAAAGPLSREESLLPTSLRPQRYVRGSQQPR